MIQGLQPITDDRQSVPDIVLENLKQAIILGQLKPGEKLTVRQLANALAVSTMPVRQALTTLIAEGYIVHNLHRAFEVAPATAEEAETIYLIRVRLEPLAAELVATLRAEDDLARLRQLVEKIEKPISENNFEQFLVADWELHDALYNACRRPKLIKLITEVRGGALRYRHLYNIRHQTVAEMSQTQHEHRTLLAALETGDTRQAGEMIASGLHRWIQGLYEILAESKGH